MLPPLPDNGLEQCVRVSCNNVEYKELKTN